MECNVVRLAVFEGKGTPFSRLDAEYVSPHLLGPEASTKRYPGKPLGELTSAYDGPTVNVHLKGEYDLVDYVSIDAIDVQDGLTYSSEIIFKDRPSRAKYVVKAGDILVANVRPNRGAVTVVTELMHGALASSGFTLRRARPDSKLKQEFLFVFLKTAFARNQLVRRSRGSMYPAVLPDDVVDVWVPLPPMKLHDSVVDRAQEGLRLHARFFELYSRQADALGAFLKKVGSPPPSPLEESPGQVLSSIRRCSEFFGKRSANRFDAEFFRSDYECFEERLTKARDSFVLGQFYRAASGRTQGRPVAEIAYLRQSVLTNIGINWSAACWEPGDPKPSRGRVRVGDVLMACTAHEAYYVARKVDLVRNVPAEFQSSNCCVPDIMIIRPKQDKPEWLAESYVAAFLRSPWGLHQVQRCIRGLRAGHVYGEDVERFVRVPIPERAWLKEFEEISEEAEETRLRAKEMIIAAVQQVDDWVAKLQSAELEEASAGLDAAS